MSKLVSRASTFSTVCRNHSSARSASPANRRLGTTLSAASATAKKARGEQIGRQIGGWFAVEWALAEFRKTGMQPMPEVVKALKREFEGR